MTIPMQTDILIIGTGVSGLFAALHIPEQYRVLMLTKSDVESSDSFLAQGGICMLKSPEDYPCYFEDTLRAGHFENDPRSVEIMLRSSPKVIEELIEYGVEFARGDAGELLFTREGAHSAPRILYHEDITGKEITSKLLSKVREKKNVTILEYTTMLDILEQDHVCLGGAAVQADGTFLRILAQNTILACGGIGGLYENSTNFPHLTGDALAVCLKHHIPLKDVDYVQIHPTTLYSQKPGRRFLISESVRGEGAVLYDKNHQRFVNELLPRDALSKAIFQQMQKDSTPFVWLSMEHIPMETILGHFPNIYRVCLEEGYDVTRECIPVVPAQHYFMGGIRVDEHSKTDMERLYAVGETSCNGVHGANRLASNSLLESLVFAERAACAIMKTIGQPGEVPEIAGEPVTMTEGLPEEILADYRTQVLEEIERMRILREQRNHHETEYGSPAADGTAGGYLQ